MKICPRCKVERPVESFKQYKEKRFYLCEVCTSDPEYIEQRKRRAKERYHKNIDYHRGYNRAYKKVANAWLKRIRLSESSRQNIEQ